MCARSRMIKSGYRACVSVVGAKFEERVRSGESCECVCAGVDLHRCVLAAGPTLPGPGPCSRGVSGRPDGQVCVLPLGPTLPLPEIFPWRVCHYSRRRRCVSQYVCVTMSLRHLIDRYYSPRNSLALVLRASGRLDGRHFRLAVLRSSGCVRTSMSACGPRERF